MEKDENFKRKIDIYHDIENQTSVQKAMKFERKHMTADQLRQEQARLVEE